MTENPYEAPEHQDKRPESTTDQSGQPVLLATLIIAAMFLIMWLRRVVIDVFQ